MALVTAGRAFGTGDPGCSGALAEVKGWVDVLTAMLAARAGKGVDATASVQDHRGALRWCAYLQIHEVVCIRIDVAIESGRFNLINRVIESTARPSLEKKQRQMAP